MNTKLIGDIAEQAVILEALKLGWGVSMPIGDRLPYDMIFDVDGLLFKIQVKSAWYSEEKANYVVDTRRTKTNRRNMIRSVYEPTDFQFAIIYLQELSVFYVMPSDVFISYGSEIHFIETDKRQRKPRSANYRNAWELIAKRAT